MKIRRKPPKPERAARPLYLIGFSSVPPALSELQRWFDLHYGGPLVLKQEERATGSGETAAVVRAGHGPWSTAFRLPLSLADAETWRTVLGWRHPHAAVVFRPALVPAQVCNLVLHAARLARGLTLLTEGTAFDLSAQVYLNPSDWQARPLDLFHIDDHVKIEQAEEGNRQWVYTNGLVKLGLDEIETFQPAGLPAGPMADRMMEIAEELARLGHAPQVGTTVTLSLLGLTVQVIRYRTASPSKSTIQLREIVWESVGQGE